MTLAAASNHLAIARSVIKDLNAAHPELQDLAFCVLVYDQLRDTYLITAAKLGAGGIEILRSCISVAKRLSDHPSIGRMGYSNEASCVGYCVEPHVVVCGGVIGRGSPYNKDVIALTTLIRIATTKNAQTKVRGLARESLDSTYISYFEDLAKRFV